jgi:Ran GTPase-activating protein (RanGAP) involved in mRNA processing and transport
MPAHHLVDLDLSGNAFEEAGGNYFFKHGIKHLHHLQYLRMRSCALKSSVVSMAQECVVPSGTAAKGSTPPACKNLLLLDLRYNSLGPDVFMALAVGFRRDGIFPALEDLDLSFNNATMAGGRALGKAFKVMGKRKVGPSLKRLHLANNKLTTQGCTPVVEALISFSVKSLTDLNISNNRHSDECDAVCRMLQEGALLNLTSLNMNGCHMGDSGLVRFGNCWKDSEMRLATLSLNNIGAAARGINAFSTVVQRNDQAQFMEMKLLQLFQPLESPKTVKAPFSKEYQARVLLITSEREILALNGQPGEHL